MRSFFDSVTKTWYKWNNYMTTMRIVIDPAIIAGHPVVRGTRIPVSLVLNLVSHGLTFADIQKEYTELTQPDIKAAVSYAEERVKREEILTA